MKSKISQITEHITDHLQQGSFGNPGELFLSVRTLANNYKVSMDSAIRIVNILKDQHLIRLCGKHYYITTGYVPPQTPYGKELDKSRRKSFGMIVNRIESPFFSSIIRYLSTETAEYGYTLHILCSNNTPEVEAKMLDELLELGVCGIFTNAGISPSIRDVYRFCPLPVVSIGRDMNLPNCDAVLVDNKNAGRQVADHLLSCRCKQFAYVGLSRYLHEDPRLKGYADQLQKKGIHLADNNILAVEFQNEIEYGGKERIARKIDTLLASLPTGEKLGIFCYHDLLAVSVLQRVRHYSHRSERSYSIPRDVAIVGFDDLPVAETITPSLTTIHYNYTSIVSQALNVMMDYIQNPTHRSCVHTIPSALFTRESTVSNTR